MSRPWYALAEEQEHEAFLKGLEQFNAGDYYAAHDTWEEIWQDLDGRRATFYRVLIQTAVIHVLMQHRQGAECGRCFGRSRTCCVNYRSAFAGSTSPKLAGI